MDCKMFTKSFLVFIHLYSFTYALFPVRQTVDNCGVAKANAGGDRIVGGRDALEGEFPWQVSLRYKIPLLQPFHICGGTVLNGNWVITAAHCVDRRSIKNFDVAVGVYKQSKKEKYFASYSVEKIIVHEEFDAETFNNDIALLKLKGTIRITTSGGFVNGICLPETNRTVTGFVTTTGWGANKEGGGMVNTLQAVELPVVPQQICSTLYGDEYYTSSMLCAGEPQGGKDSCQGDSGGPLVQKQEDGRSVLVGIVSWGIGCARPGLPGIYTAVPVYNDWINVHAT